MGALGESYESPMGARWEPYGISIEAQLQPYESPVGAQWGAYASPTRATCELYESSMRPP